MRTHVIFSLTGRDRVGIVEMVTGLLLKRGGNVETSRMVRLGREFAILMLVAIPAEQLDGLRADSEKLAAQGYRVSISQTEGSYARPLPGWLPYRITVEGADHEGIIHEIARYLAQCGVNIESMDTEITQAPVSGTPLFAMTALVAAPPDQSAPDWQTGLSEVGRLANVEIRMFPA